MATSARWQRRRWPAVFCRSATTRPARQPSSSLGAVALTACALPAHRASRIEPLEALRDV
jgi:hypothetical protein